MIPGSGRSPGEGNGNPLQYFCLENPLTLSDEQQTACDSLLADYRDERARVSLLYGVTGSGKTSVFMKLIERVTDDGKGVIVMVPEISLTPQFVSLFTKRFGDRIAVFHSALSLGERLDEYKRVKKGSRLPFSLSHGRCHYE